MEKKCYPSKTMNPNHSSLILQVSQNILKIFFDYLRPFFTSFIQYIVQSLPYFIFIFWALWSKLVNNSTVPTFFVSLARMDTSWNKDFCYFFVTESYWYSSFSLNSWQMIEVQKIFFEWRCELKEYHLTYRAKFSFSMLSPTSLIHYNRVFPLN